MESNLIGFRGEIAALRAAASESVVDAVCRMPRLRRAFRTDIELLNQRLARLELASLSPGMPVSRHMVRRFWYALAALSATAFSAGFALGRLN